MLVEFSNGNVQELAGDDLIPEVFDIDEPDYVLNSVMYPRGHVSFFNGESVADCIDFIRERRLVLHRSWKQSWATGEWECSEVRFMVAGMHEWERHPSGQGYVTCSGFSL